MKIIKKIINIYYITSLNKLACQQNQRNIYKHLSTRLSAIFIKYF